MASDPPPSDPGEQAPGPVAKPARPGVLRGLVRWLQRLVLLGLLAGLLGAAGLWLLLRHYERDLPSIDELRHYAPPQTTRVLARDGTLLAELFVERRTVVRIAQIPPVARLAVLAAEDADFYEHAGLDYLGMLRALYVNLRSGSMRQGGSTITQQVVKNVLLTPERSFARKAREVLLARRIEQELGKDDILELYLNHICFGHGRYGIEEASRYYFGKGVGEISLAEAALLAGLPKGPAVFSPRVDPGRARRRRDEVLEQVRAKGFAPRETVEQAIRSPIALAPEVETMAELAPEAVGAAERMLHDLVGQAAVRGGYTVTTTIDPGLQAAARAALRRSLDAYAERHGLLGPPRKHAPAGPSAGKVEPFQGVPSAQGHHVYWAVVTGAGEAPGTLGLRVGSVAGRARIPDRYNPKELPASAFAEPGQLLRVSPVLERGLGADGLPHEFRIELGPQGALVAIDARSREIRALVGGYEALRGALDRATSARRQPGSAFKTFVYAQGIQSRRLTPASVVGRTPATAEHPDGLPLLLRDAVARSVNEAAVAALEQLGPENVVSFAHAMGIQSRLGADLSLALGAYEVTPLELAAAYAPLAAGGLYEPPTLIAKIVGQGGRSLELPPRPPARRVMDEAAAYVVTSVLTSVVQDGTGRQARVLGPGVAGKTGTSNDARDGWFAGYSADLVCVVWIGYDDAVPLGRRESGATAAVPVFVDFMRQARAGRPAPAFAAPPGIERVAIDRESGLRAYPAELDPVDEVFVTGTAPTEVAEPPDAGADVAADAAAEAAEGGAPTRPAGDAGPSSGGDAGPRPEPPPF